MQKVSAMTQKPPEMQEVKQVWLQVGFGDEGETTWCDHSTGWEPEIGPFILAAPKEDAEKALRWLDDNVIGPKRHMETIRRVLLANAGRKE